MKKSAEWTRKENVKRHIYWVCSLFLLVSLGGEAEENAFVLDRPNLKDLETKSSVEKKDYIYPFLVSQTVVRSSLSKEKLIEKMEKYLRLGTLPYKGHHKSSGLPHEKLNTNSFIFPKFFSDQKLIKEINDCKTEACELKLHFTSEAKVIEKAAEKEKLKAYKDIIIKRLRSFMKDRELKGYGSRLDNLRYYKKSFRLLKFFEEDYPGIFRYASRIFWAGGTPPPQLEETFLHQELLKFKFSKTHLVWRLGEVFRFKVKDRMLFLDIQIYSSHFFDSSFTLYEIIPKGKRNLVVMTDVMELDEMKKSGFVRLMYTKKRQDTLAAHQKKVLSKLK